MPDAHEASDDGEQTICRLIRAADIEGAVVLMQRIGVHFGGTRSNLLLTAVAREAVSHPHETIIALAERRNQLCGIVIAFTKRPRRYWSRFALRHPREALAMATHRLTRTMRRRFARSGSVDSGINEGVAETSRLFAPHLVFPGTERWSDDDERIAKVMYVAVDPGYRRGGIGTVLYRWFFLHLRDAGFVRCDAQVSAGNVGAALLHQRFPFRIVEAPGGYYLWLLPREVMPT